MTRECLGRRGVQIVLAPTLRTRKMSIDGDGDGDCDSPVDLEKGATEVKAAAMKGAKKEVNPRLAMCVKVALVRLNSSLNYRVSNFSHAVVHICRYTYIFFLPASHATTNLLLSALVSIICYAECELRGPLHVCHRVCHVDGGQFQQLVGSMAGSSAVANGGAYSQADTQVGLCK